ncbi:MAG: class I SAM-dependent methyltransferase [Pirellulales bacterium]|nr:class I SAM-dependent methyltransferase [Pirellulales bacterium]
MDEHSTPTVGRRPSPGSRGNRLYPSRKHFRYGLLTMLRREIEEIIARHLPSAEQQLQVLDYGCGNMPYRPLFERAGARYTGADFLDNPLADLAVDRDGRTGCPDGSYDVVVSTQVLEHVASPAGYLGECRRLLRGQGRLILSTHGYWRYHPDPVDYWRWTAEGLRKILGDAGFDVIRLQGVIGFGGVVGQLFQDVMFSKIPRWLRSPYAFLMQSVILMIDRRYSPAERERDALVYVAVAEKVE